MFQNHTFILGLIAAICMLGLITYGLFFRSAQPFLNNRRGGLALGLILGGAAGNLFDRLNTATEGVTDFISVGFWPVFNIADSAIVTGAILLGLLLILSYKGKHNDNAI